METPYEIWLQTAQWYLRRTEAYLYYKLTNEPKGSWWANEAKYSGQTSLRTQCEPRSDCSWSWFTLFAILSPRQCSNFRIITGLTSYYHFIWLGINHQAKRKFTLKLVWARAQPKLQTPSNHDLYTRLVLSETLLPASGPWLPIEGPAKNWSDCTEAQAHLGLCWLHMPFAKVWLCPGSLELHHDKTSLCHDWSSGLVDSNQSAQLMRLARVLKFWL